MLAKDAGFIGSYGSGNYNIKIMDLNKIKLNLLNKYGIDKWLMKGVLMLIYFLVH